MSEEKVEIKVEEPAGVFDFLRNRPGYSMITVGAILLAMAGFLNGGAAAGLILGAIELVGMGFLYMFIREKDIEKAENEAYRQRTRGY